MNIIVTGGAGFIGSALIRYLIDNSDHKIINVDKLSYAANLRSLAEIEQHPNYQFEHLDICNRDAIHQVFQRYKPDAILHLAGETHVDRSLTDPDVFVQSNIVGTQVLLECARHYWLNLGNSKRKNRFRFLYVSTDEVYGSRSNSESVDEEAPYLPNSPYAGSKAAATHLVRSYFQSYQLPVLTTYCSNNFGPWQYPEKLIPKTINNALQGKAIPLYGQGSQSRDWLYVDDHVRALLCILEKAVPGQGYNINGGHEISNLDLVHKICQQLDQLQPGSQGQSYTSLIRFVDDRPGHDFRYGIDDSRLRQHLGWVPQETFENGLSKTITWHLMNQHKA